MINIEKIKEAREILGIEIQNNIQMLDYYDYEILCESAGILDSLISRLKKNKK